MKFQQILLRYHMGKICCPSGASKVIMVNVGGLNVGMIAVCDIFQKLTEITKETVSELGLDAEIVKVDKIDDIMNYGVMITPAIAG